jgi:hypothetical protein
MQYMILVYEPEEAYATADGQAKLKEVVAKHMALAGELIAAGIQKEGAGLQGTETATTIATSNGQQTLHDGPFAETREHLGGYYVIEVPNLDDAIAIARRVPVIDGGKVEVRPLIVH